MKLEKLDQGIFVRAVMTENPIYGLWNEVCWRNVLFYFRFNLGMVIYTCYLVINWSTGLQSAVVIKVMQNGEIGHVRFYLIEFKIIFLLV